MPFSLDSLTVTRVVAVNRVSVEVGQYQRRTGRERFAFAYKTTGGTVYRQGDRTLRSDASHIILLPRGATYQYVCEERGLCLMVEFEAEGGDDTLRSYEVTAAEPLTALYSRMERLHTFPKPGSVQRCRGCLCELLALLAERETANYARASKLALIRPSIAYLEAHYDESGLSVERMAALSGISTVYFRKIFTAAYGVGPARYLRAIRLAKARDLLLSDYPSVRAVAQATGFSSIYQFDKAFRQETGQTPTEFSRAVGANGLSAP